MKKVLIACVVSIVSLVLWYVFTPSYEYKYHAIPNCQGGGLTTILYSRIGERGLIFATGKHEEVPDKNYIIYRHLSGFDAYFNSILMCKGRVVTINYLVGHFDPKHTANNIVMERVDIDTFENLMNSKERVYIEFY